MKKNKQGLLTDVELEFMSIIWRLNRASVNDVLENLSEERNLKYTSVSTILRILEQKGVLRAEKQGRGHIYIPALSKEEYESRTIRHMVNKVFDGTPVALVRQLLGSIKIKPEDLSELKQMLEQMEKKS